MTLFLPSLAFAQDYQSFLSTFAESEKKRNKDKSQNLQTINIHTN